MADTRTMLPIEVRGLTLPGEDRPLLDNITCRITGGGITALLGPNGAGKSLFMRCLHGLTTPAQGRIRFGGRKLNHGMRRRQSFVFQQPTLLRRTVLENMRFVARIRGIGRDEAHRWLEKVGLADHLRQPAQLLSGGEKQRLALARALLVRPEILFLDEASANLDPASVLMIETITREAADDGTKVITVTHDTAQAKRIADDVLFIARGAVLEHGPAKSFFAKPQSAEARAYLKGRLVV